MNSVAEPTYTIFEDCAGVGMLGVGLQLALEQLGIYSRVVGGCEREASAAAAFMAGLENEGSGGAAVWDDATTFLSRRARGVERVDAFCSGYPCQPFSHAGSRDGSSDDRHIWPSVRRTIARLEPELVFLENVDGHVSMGAWKVCRDLERLGYRVTAGLFTASEVGAPHRRKRLFILGLADSNEFGRNSADVPVRERQQRQSRPDASGRREGVGDTGRAGIQQRENSGGQRSPDACGPIQRVDDPTSIRQDGEGVGADDGSERGGQCVPQQGCDELGDSGSDGQRASGRPEAEMSDQRHTLFPPSRTDYDAWARAVEAGLDRTRMPAIESGVSVVADGMAPPADLLRLGGNGVVPLQAAWAMLNLFACLMEPVEDDAACGPLFAGASN